SLADGFAVLAVAGRFAAPVPIAETLLAGWLLARAGIAVPAGPLTLAPCRSGDPLKVDPAGTLSGQARGIPFARDAGHIAVLAGAKDAVWVALVPAPAYRIVPGQNLAGDPCDTVL